jgi:hypothetical protein
MDNIGTETNVSGDNDTDGPAAVEVGASDDDPFARMADFLADETLDNVIDDDGIIGLIAEVRALAPAEVNIPNREEFIEVAEFDDAHNVLDPTIRERFKHETIFEPDQIFTTPISTTNTMEGYISNVKFHESELILEVLPDEDVVIYRCNYGKVIYEGYTEPVVTKLTNRGRKKKTKKKKFRKKQGNGTDFNSQLTFVIRSPSVAIGPPNSAGICEVPSSAQVYKFKVFRTGKIQLPGVHQRDIDNVIASARLIAQILNVHLHPGVHDPACISQMINMNPVMKNYKFTVRVPPGHILDLKELGKLVADEKERGDGPLEDDDYMPPSHPPIFMWKYSRQDSKLSIQFSTPIYRKPKKETRINIFMRGRINILGAFNIEDTRRICDYLHWLFEMYPERVIVPECCDDEEEEPLWTANITPMSEEEYAAVMYESLHWLPSIPAISEEEYAAIMELVDEAYAEKIRADNLAISEFFTDTDLRDFFL